MSRPVVVDARMLAYPLTGIGRYALEFLTGLVRQVPAEWVLLSHAAVPESIKARVGEKVRWVEGDGRGRAEPWIQRRATTELRRTGAHLFLGLANSVPLWRPLGVRYALVVYDLTFLVVPRWTALQDLVKGWLVNLPAILRADVVLTISAAVRDDLMRRFSWLERRSVALPPAGTVLTRGPGLPREARSGFIAVGAHPRKNTPLLLQAYARLPADVRQQHPLFIIARNLTPEIAGLVDRLGVASQVRLLPHASDGELAEMYQRAVALVYPSRYEGLGLPVAEALLAGLPSVVPPGTPMADFLCGGGVVLGSVTVAEVAQAMQRLATDIPWWVACASAAGTAAASLRWDRVTEVARTALQLV
ncbi:MAG TPA: glycosyltransferase family 1 protein [Gemmatimonadales bacterium]|nr:glycosyltransferase family 1 protein [Gemmatimonadales bacterium]